MSERATLPAGFVTKVRLAARDPHPSITEAQLRAIEADMELAKAEIMEMNITVTWMNKTAGAGLEDESSRTQEEAAAAAAAGSENEEEAMATAAARSENEVEVEGEEAEAAEEAAAAAAVGSGEDGDRDDAEHLVCFSTFARVAAAIGFCIVLAAGMGCVHALRRRVEHRVRSRRCRAIAAAASTIFAFAALVVLLPSSIDTRCWPAWSRRS